MDIGTALDFGLSLFNNAFNIGIDRRNFNYQKQLQKELFARDDNAMQRRLADYKAAGINPLMALGGSASGNSSAGGYTSSPGVDIHGDFKNAEQRKLDREQTKFAIDKIDTDIKLLNEQIRSAGLSNDSLMEDIRRKEIEYKILKKQYENMENSNFWPLSNIGKIISDVGGLGQNVLDFSILNPKPQIIDFLQKNIQYPSPETIDKIKSIGQAASEKVDNFVQNITTPKEKEYKVKPFKNPPISSNYTKTIKFFNDNHKNVKLHWVYDKGINPKGRGTMRLWSVSKKKYYSPNFYDYNSVVRFLKNGDYEK